MDLFRLVPLASTSAETSVSLERIATATTGPTRTAESAAANRGNRLMGSIKESVEKLEGRSKNE
jgi:hypothetical protein